MPPMYIKILSIERVYQNDLKNINLAYARLNLAAKNVFKIPRI